MYLDMKNPHQPKNSGFALVATLLLMILLLILVAGTQSLATISLRSSKHSSAHLEAQANARMALMLAIGELQKQTGPDQRITVTADQLASNSDGKTTAAQPNRRHWTGVYKSWPDTALTRPIPEFQRWLVSAPETDASNPDYARSASISSTVEIVGKGTVGDATAGLVEVPLIDIQNGGKVLSRYAWWVGDQGVKAHLATPAPGTSTDLAATRQRLQSSPRNALELATTDSNNKPFATVTDTQARKLISWKQAELLTATIDAPKPLFHDLAIRSTGLLTNVCSGGFRKDLSMQLEQPLNTVKNTALYTVGGSKGINQGELWAYYNLYKELKTGGNFTYTTGGGSIGTNTPYLQIKDTLATFRTDSFSLYKEPTIVSTKIILSLYGEDVGGKVRVSLVADPVVTYWNPLDVPLVITPAYHTIKFWQLPYDFRLTYPSGTTQSKSIMQILTLGSTVSDFVRLRIGAGVPAVPVVLRPGEVVMFSHGSNPSPQAYSAGRYDLNAKVGWGFGGGMKYALGWPDADPGDELKYEFRPNALQASTWYLTANDVFYGNASSAASTYHIGSGISIDRAPALGGLPTTRLRANDASLFPFFNKVPITATRPLTAAQLVNRKEPLMIFSLTAKTEQESDRPGRFLARYNPRAGTDFQVLTPDELETLPYEIRIEPLNSWKNRNIEVSTTGRSYFGGGLNAGTGTSFLTTHSVPREPLVSLAAFQNSFANGFIWDPAYPNRMYQGTYLLPQISHAIGNSIAPAVIASYDTESSMASGARPLADHSYLANKALWDDWFLSSAAPQSATSFPTKLNQRQITQQFLEGTRSLPNSRYLFELPETTESTDDLLSRWFDASGLPNNYAIDEFASVIRVEGMFNVNSTSVEAWRTFLAGLRNQQTVVRDANGQATIVNTTGTPVLSVQNPENVVAEVKDLGDVVSAPQWIGRRVLTDTEIDELARAIVVEVRKRGPFLSLADFINRRPGSDTDLAKAGTVQSALDSPEVSINTAYNKGVRAVAVGTGRAYTFPEAENGPAAYGIPGVVKQADILTPLAPYLSARSDTFVIRGYGETLDKNGVVIARAWCEAEVTRGSAFVDPVDEATSTSLSPMNQLFGRRYHMISFRWLHPSEI